MKIAILSESPADEGAARILVEAILGRPIVPMLVSNRRPPGYSGVPKTLPIVLRSLYFNPDSDGAYADGLVVIVDANGTALHEKAHDLTPTLQVDCRLCGLRATARQELSRLTAVPGRQPLRCAIGLAVPCIEAWLLSRREAGMTEANWRIARSERPPREPFTRMKLKEMAYGTTRPTLELASARMREYAQEIAGELDALKTAFPGGFGTFLDEVNGWRADLPHESQRG